MSTFRERGSKLVNHTVYGRLRGDLCGDCHEPLAGMVVRLYLAGSTDGGRSTGETAEAPQILDDSMIKSRAGRLLVEATTYQDGWFAATLPEQRYDGGAIDVDVYCRTVPGLERPRGKQNPVQVHVTRLEPNWSSEPYREIIFKQSLPASVWCRVREMFGAWVICGRVVEHETGNSVADAVVHAFDTDLVQDDPLGTAAADRDGRFRIDYTADDFKRTPLSPLVNIELIGGPDLYFRVESYKGTSLLDEPRSMGRSPGRENVGSCACVELSVPAPAPMPYYDPAWDPRREAEFASSFEPGRTPIARDGDNYFRPFELLISSETFEALRTELTERYGARLYYPNPEELYWRSTYRGAPAEPPDINRRLQDSDIDLRLYVLSRDLDPNSMVRVVRTMRSRLSESGTASGDSGNDPGLGIHINHVMFAEQFYHPGPAGPPSPIDPPSPIPGPTGLPKSIDIAVLDTGVPAKWETDHQELSGNVWPDNDDIDQLDVTDPTDGLDSCAGHGLFIIGLIHRMYGDLQVDPGLIFSPVGDVDVAGLAAELPGNTAPVINLSFGGYTTDPDTLTPPLPLAQTITNLIDNGRVVVAAAGNNGCTQPFWPAAIPGVIAVGAWDSTLGQPPQIAFFSNYGPWVDVYAPGVSLLSAYVKGRSDNNGTPFDGWAKWSGTSFATPQVTAEIAKRARNSGKSHKTVAGEMLASSGPNALPPAPWQGAKLYVPPVDLTE